MSAVIERRGLTNLLLITLAELGHPVGDGSIPTGSGWSGPGPNAPGSHFTAYLVLTALTALPAPDTGDFGVPQGDWHMPYSVQSFGASREQAEWMADLARVAFAGLEREVLTLGNGNYKLQQVWTVSIGGNNRVPQTDPPYWSQQDSSTFWLARRTS